MRILFTGGGTGGHVFPIIAIAKQLKKIDTELELYFIGASGFENAFKEEGIKTKTILAAKIRRYFSIQNITDLFKIPIGLIQSLIYLYLWMPDVVFNKGGFGSVPVVIAAWIYCIPVLTHESDTIPGLANRLNGKFSKRIAISFEKAGQYFPEKKTALIGNPTRSEITQICLSDNPETKEKAKNILKITTEKPIILVIGGSQGAQAINQIILSTIPQLLEKYEIIHQCGTNNLKEVKQKTSQISSNNYHLFSFLDRDQISAAYLLSDLVISRASANSMTEISSCGKPSILIPLPNSGSGHQKENAFTYAQAGASIVIEQENLTPNIFLNEVNKISNDLELKQKMSSNTKIFANPDSAQKIAQALIEMGR